MKMQHTPAPWVHNIVWGLINSKETEICALHNGNQANARLIAAAPEMLKALRDAAEVMELAKQYFPKSIRNDDRFALLNVQTNSVQKAIAKATG